MKVDRVELNSDGIRELMQSEEMTSFLNQKAQSAVSKLGKGYSYDTMVGKTRANADVHATNKKTQQEAINNSTIVKAVFG